MKALVVDDSRAMRMILSKILGGLGFEVVQAGHGKEALDKLGPEAPPAVALIDWNMPKMDGFELLSALRADARYDQMRIMMVTTETEATQMGRALDNGADEYVMKPFTEATIVEKLEMVGVSSP